MEDWGKALSATFQHYTGDIRIRKINSILANSIPFYGTILSSVLSRPIWSATPTYVRNTIYRDDNIEIVHIKWMKGAQTPMHSHPENGCWVQIISGVYEEITTDGNAFLQTPGHISYRKGKQSVHQLLCIEAGHSIHIYSPPGYYDERRI